MFMMITPDNRAQHIELVKSMHKLRHKIFIDELKWPLGPIKSIDGMEFDQFDTADTYYLVRVSGAGEVDACARLMPTSIPNLLCDVFPDLIQNIKKPCSDDIWEISRFCAARETAPKNIVGQLVAGMLEFALSNGIRRYVSMSDIRIEPVLRRYGWDPQRLGAPINTGTDTAAGEIYPIGVDTLAKVRNKTGLISQLVVNLPELKNGIKEAA